MKVLITGAGGQLGHALQAVLTNHELVALSHSQLDITRFDDVRKAVTAHQPDIVINAAAYTNVDRAETDQPGAYKLNAIGPRNLAVATEDRCIPFVHVSTDYVFDGLSNRPYHEFDRTNPLSIYGKSKLAGEQAVAAHNPHHYIVRTAWLYHTEGENFPKAMLAQAQRDEIRVVCDQFGSPTYAPHLVVAMARLIETGAKKSSAGWRVIAEIVAFIVEGGIMKKAIIVMLVLMLFDEAVAQTSRAESAKSYLERGNSWLKKGEIARAIADYGLAIAFDPRAAVAYHNRSIARQQKGDLVGALSDCDRAIELNPRYADAYLNRGAIRYALGQPDAAIVDFNRVIEINPRDARAWSNRGLARGKQGAFDAAIADFDQAIRLDSRNATMWSNRCGARYLQGAPDAALADCDRALKLDARLAIAWNNRGLARLEKGALEGALADFDRAIALDPQQADFYANRGRAWLVKGDAERALRDLDQSLKLDPNVADAWLYRGAAWFAKQDYSRAIADFDETLKLNPRLADAYASRGVAWLMQGKLAEAEADFARCRSLGGTLGPEAEKLLRETRHRLSGRTIR